MKNLTNFNCVDSGIFFYEKDKTTILKTKKLTFFKFFIQNLENVVNYLTAFPKLNGDLTDVEVDEVLGFVCNE